MLTVVVPTIPGRESLLSRCLHSITSQTPQVGVLVVEGTAGLGHKITVAAGIVPTGYMTVVDDDDYLDGSYTASVVPLLGSVDYVGFRFVELNRGRFENIAGSSAEFNMWGRHNRGPVPKGVTRTDIFRQTKFGDDYYADRAWSTQARARIESWVFVDRPLYVHDWWPDVSSFGDTRCPRDVGMWPHGPVDRVTVNKEP